MAEMPTSGFGAATVAHSMISSATLPPHQKLVETQDVTFLADDGFPLAGTLFCSTDKQGPLVLISGATAVARGYYTKFAMACVNSGARAALIYDYRGVAGSRVPTGWVRRINMKDWGVLDMPAAMDFLDGVAPDAPMIGVGHSIGGTNLGLCGQSGRYSKFAMVAAALGTLSLTDEEYSLYMRMNIFGLPVASLLGKAPGWLGIGETLPRSVFNDWARWCRQPNYLFDDPAVSEKDRFNKVRTNVLSVSMEDDPWATGRAVNALQVRFPYAEFRRWQISSAAGGTDRIGHFGFFRSKFSAILWPGVMGWMMDTAVI